MECSDKDREDMEKRFRESLVTALQEKGASTEKREGRVGVADEGEGLVGVANKATDRYDIDRYCRIRHLQILVELKC